MLRTVIKRNAYQDSINLMLLTNEINALPGVRKSQIMMGTDANKDILRGSGLLSEEAAQAGPNDMVIAVDADDEGVLDVVVARSEEFLGDLSARKGEQGATSARSWDEALAALPDANLALFSIPGEYAAPEIERALDRGLHVFSFTDNVPLEDEVRLKRKAREKGLLLMGPDCGTGLVGGVPVAFTNEVREGSIGVVGASGTGIQEVTCIIDRLGGGVAQAIGTGGRDLSAEVGAITMRDALLGLEHSPAVKVICVISKPPAPEVRDELVGLLQRSSKPVVAVFLGERPERHLGNVRLAHTLEEVAQMAVDLAAGREVRERYDDEAFPAEPAVPADARLVGLYSGGTLASEAGMLISEALGRGELVHERGYVLRTEGYEIVDLGDDLYTQGRPHPMMDPSTRVDHLRRAAEDPATGIILFDCVLGRGSHPDMASALASVIGELRASAHAQGRELVFVGSVTGTSRDAQGLERSVEALRAAGALVEPTNARAVRRALALRGLCAADPVRGVAPGPVGLEPLPEPSTPVRELLSGRPRVINVGLESFAEDLWAGGARVVHFAWKPVAGGNKHMAHLLQALEAHAEQIDAANERVIARMRDSQPFLVDVRPAGEVIPEVRGRVLLHAGPPICWEDMSSPMQGSCIGAALFEGWAADEDAARALFEAGEVTFRPCHSAHAVGPMGGITSESMPVLVVENRAGGTRGYCTMNEGIGKVLRFGAYDQEVVDRLHWMADVLGPVLGAALRAGDGVNLNVLVAKAIAMGDEFHQRNIAASLCLLKEVTPLILGLAWDEGEKRAVIGFLAETDQFFLNVMMAAGKSIVDYARQIEEGCVVTTMSRNGKDFGIRIAACGDEWFTAPVNTPVGLYFTGYAEKDGAPDMGDSAITETIGVGGMAMVAAPAVTRFVGAGGFEDAVRYSEEGERICVSHNPNWPIPTWDFKGTNLGIDIRKVVETGIEPTINTGIAHRQAGKGQIGAGTVKAPLGCFERALEAYCRKLGVE